MRLAVVFGMNQLVSHGFGLFLFSALVPLMRESTGLNYWHLALAGALAQLAYLGGALLVGLIGPRLGTRRLALVCALVSTLLLFLMPLLRQPVAIILTLVCLAGSAAMSWGAIVEIVSRCIPADRCSTCLSSAASGTAWGYGIIGLLMLWVVPVWGWENGWRLASLVGVLVFAVTWFSLRGVQEAAGTQAPGEGAIKGSALLRTLFADPVAFYACTVCLLVGFWHPAVRQLAQYLSGGAGTAGGAGRVQLVRGGHHRHGGGFRCRQAGRPQGAFNSPVDDVWTLCSGAGCLRVESGRNPAAGQLRLRHDVLSGMGRGGRLDQPPLLGHRDHADQRTVHGHLWPGRGTWKPLAGCHP